MFLEFFFLYLIIGSFRQSIYLILDDERIVGRNSFKRKMGEIKYNDIEEIKTDEFRYDTVITDIHGNKLHITTGI